MRKVISILILAILAFNWLGYELVVSFLISKNNKHTQQNIEKGNYPSSQLIEIKVDLKLPYATDWTNFEAVEGIVTYNGIVYNFVERKYENGYMIYRCLPNNRGTELQNAREYFYSLVFDMDIKGSQDSAPKQTLTAKKLNIETTILDLSPIAIYCLPSSINTPHLPAKAAKDGFGFIPSEPPEA